jgi:arsenate reductase
MAEGLLRELDGENFEVHSAGTEETFLKPQAVEAMGELGIDVSAQESKTLGRYLEEPFEYVVTVCDSANESCPVFPNAGKLLHWSLPDPSKTEGSEEERLDAFRRVRDELRERIERELVGKGNDDV